ncbi:MAG: hypothetical protein ACYC9Y_06320 [Candidatus Methylomirabilia bacterium]
MGMTAARVLSRTVAGFLVLCLGSAGNLFAADATEPTAPEMNPGAEKTIEGAVQGVVEGVGEKIGDKIGEQIGEQNVAKIDDAHEDSARFIGLFFEKIDRVFGEQYVEDRDRKIQVRLGLETTFNDNGESTDTRGRIGLRVPLPALKRRFNVFVDLGGDVNELGDVSSPNFSESEKIVSIAAGVLRRFGDNLEAGLKLKLFRQSGAFFSLYPFLRFEHEYPEMRYFFEQQVIWESDNTWSTLTDFDVDRRFRSGLLLRLRNRIDYSLEEPGASIAHGLIVRRSVLEKNGISLELWLEYNTAKDDPETIADDTIVYAQLRLRGRIWRNWLQYELRPIYTFPIATDRKSFFGFFVSLTVIWDSFLGGDEVPQAALDR